MKEKKYNPNMQNISMPDYVVNFCYKTAKTSLSVRIDRYGLFTNVFLPFKSKSHAKRLMEALVKYADEYKLVLDLPVLTYGDFDEISLNNHNLINFYKKFGFYVVEDDYSCLTRYPK